MMQVLAALLAGVGAPIGAYIGRLAKTELKEGERNIRLLGHVLLSVIVYFALAEYLTSTWFPVLAALVTGGALIYYDFHAVKHKAPSFIIIVILALILFSFLNNEDFALIASLMFMYNVAIGTLCDVAKTWRLSLQYAAAFLIAFGLAWGLSFSK